MKDAIYFDDYETISDLLIALGQGCSLKMCVNLGMKNKENERQSAINEYLYRTNKYNNKDKVISVKRKFFPYLSIEYKDSGEILGKGTIRITHYDILGFRNKVMVADTILEKAFAIKGKKLIIKSGENYDVTTIVGDHKIVFSPVVIQNQDQTVSMGIRLVLNNYSFVDVPDRTWKAFVYYILTADLYGWAASIVSGYTQDTIGKCMTDMRNISKDPTIYDTFNEDVGFKNTKPITKEEKKKSFFDD